jgi:GDP-L-fucose synthase
MEVSRLTGVSRFANPISNCSYPGELTVDFRESEWWNGPLHESVLTYGLVRKASWVQARAYYKQYGLEPVSVILPNMYGPGDHFDETRSHALGALIMKFVEAKRNDLPQVTVWGSGKPIREWLYVDDGAEALTRALTIPYEVEPVNVGTGKGISVIDLASLIRETVSYKGDIALDTSMPDGAPHKTMDVTRMRQVFKWSPATGLREGIEKTVQWYERNVKQ